MALANTTLSSACAVNDTSIVVASATGFAAGYYVVIDGEVCKVAQSYSSGTTIPLLRGRNGTYNIAHPASAKVSCGPASDSEWGSQAPQTLTQYPNVKAIQRQSYSAAGAITLPNPGADMYAEINGTAALAMTVADPVEAQDGSRLWIISNGAAAHTITFASGLSGAGSSYDVLTVNATKPVALGPFTAVNGFWQAPVGVAMSGTVTNITAALS